ncbi:MAG: S9 family peptidase [Planctomycetes bacterium]|nr:S9 family peptidase [Planctomycetota bacterium]
MDRAPSDAGSSAATGAAAQRLDIETLLASLRLSGLDLSPDGARALFSSNASGVFNAYEVEVANGAVRPLTSSRADAIYALAYFPRDARVLFTADQGGNELNHLYARETDGTVRDLTPGEKLKAMFVDFAHDEQSLFAVTNERDARYFDLYEIALDGYAKTLVYQNEIGVRPALVSRDERYVALEKPNTTSDNDVLLLDRETGEVKNLTAHAGVESNDALAFTKRGSLLLATNRDAEFSQLVELDLASGERTTLFAPRWDVVGAELTPDDRALLVTVNADARTALHLLHAETLAEIALPELPAGDLSAIAFAKDGRSFACYLSSSRVPASLYAARLGGSSKLLVSSLHPEIAAEDLVEGEVVRFASYDGLEIPGILYLPHGASAKRPAPAMVWVHGGPGGQSRLSYSPLIQYLVGHGYAIYAINNRGSSGYGKSFHAADDRKHGEADLEDVVASKAFLAAHPAIDDERIGIMGGSYGGYMTLAALAFRPDSFQLGVDIFGVANWLRTLESIPAWWEAQRQALYAELGDPATDRERLTRISPLFHADKIRRPLMVLQGANDPRVLQVESDEIVAAAQKQGVPVEYLVFPDEGHGFVKRENEARGYAAVLAFLQKHL